MGSLRRGEGGLERFLTSAAEAFVGGARVDWARVFTGTGARRIDLPTYAFQEQHFWIEPTADRQGDVASAGLASADHPLLGAAVALPETGGHLFTGRLSLRSHPWLADHVLHGSALLPTSVFVELAMRAADAVGCDRLEELTPQTPLALPEGGAAQLQLAVSGPDASGRRALSVYSRHEDESSDLSWTCHARGVLSTGAPVAADPVVHGLGQWPPADADPIDVTALYESEAADAGLVHGPAFRALRQAWRRGEEIFAEVALPEDQRADTGRYGLHPVLLDAALHVMDGSSLGADGATVVLPHAWNGVSLYATGATTLRVRLSPAAETGVALLLADESGQAVATVEAVTTRRVTPDDVTGGDRVPHQSLFRVEWAALPTASVAAAESDARLVVVGPDAAELQTLLAGTEAAGHPYGETYTALTDVVNSDKNAPAYVLLPFLSTSRTVTDADADGPGVVRSVTRRALGVLQEWLGEERYA
ncbi:polyketide synthase dehydratase domain-containing protein, partial [Streptomyces flaveolus]|uniref:polyketide synthase dehydratase domain-containing protein n=1 Tax=Streptomyces flaveolus TaxID=67297 RepID=UPI003318E32C